MKRAIKAGRWNYTLKCGNAIRKAVYDENLPEILRQILEAYKELLAAGLIDEDDFARYTEDFELYLYDDFQDWEDPEGTVDYELDNLYDLCDAIGVWIPIGSEA